MTPPSPPRSLRSSVATAVVTNLLRGFIGFVTGLVIARGLGPAGRGSFTFITNATMIAVLLGSGGISSALARAKVAEGKSPQELYLASAIVAAAVGGVGATIIFASYRLAPSVFAGIGGGQVFWVILLVIPLLVMSNWTAVGYLEDRVREFTLAALAGSVVFLAAIAVLLVSFGLTTGSLTAAWGLSSLVPLLFVGRARLARPTTAGLKLARRLLNFGSRANLATLALVLTWRIDVVLVKAHRGLRELGLYAVAVGIGEIFIQIAVSLRVALTPRQGSGLNRSSLVDTIGLASRCMTAMGIAAVFGSLVLSRTIISVVYGSEFEPAALALVWLMPGVAALALQGPLLDFLLVEGRLRGVTVSTTAGLVVNIVMNSVLLRNHSFLLAAVASTVAYVVSCTGCVALFCRATGQPLRALLLFTPRDATTLWASARLARLAR